MKRTPSAPTLFTQPVTAHRSPRMSARYTRMAVSSALMEKYFQAGAPSIPAFREKFVRVAPGHTVVTLTPVPCSSRASAVENDSTNTFAAP